MKMLNIASIDPAITSTGRVGLGNASALDRAVWDKFHADWNPLAVECQLLRQQLDNNSVSEFEPETDAFLLEEFTGETRQTLATQRIKQHFFRRAVLSSYRGRCCMSGLSDSRLLIASHTVPWSRDRANRLNPSNRLCMSAIHDRASDKGLISLTDDGRVVLSDEIRRRDEVFIKTTFLPLENQPIEIPERLALTIIFTSSPDGYLFGCYVCLGVVGAEIMRIPVFISRCRELQGLGNSCSSRGRHRI